MVRLSAAAQATLCYMAASVGMVISNKEAVSRLHAGTILLALQFFTTILATLLLHCLGLKTISGDRQDVWRWLPIGLLSGLLFWTGMQAIKYASLSTLTVLRNASPLFLLGAERILFGADVTPAMLASICLILFGVFMYGVDDLSAQASLGIIFVLLDAAMVCIDRLAEKHMLQIQPISLSTSALVLETNVVSLCFMIALLIGPLNQEWENLSLSTAGITWGLISCVVGAAIAFAGVALARNLSATAALIVTNVDKVLVMIYGLLILGDTIDALRLCGCFLAIGGGAWHAYARLQASEVPEESPEPTGRVVLIEATT